MSIPPNLIAITAVIIIDQISADLRRCLESVKWVNEVVIVDPSGTVQQTDISKLTELPVVVQTIGDLKDFAVARNAGAKAASNDWILQIDSDEYFEADSQNLAQWWEALSPTTVKAISFWRQDVFYGKRLQWGEIRKQWHPRLYDRRFAHFVQPVHEVLYTTHSIERSPFILVHAAHASFAEMLLSVERYAPSAASMKRSKTTKCAWWELLTYPGGKALQNIFLYQGWRDGWRGIAYAVAMSWHSWLVRAYMYEQTS